MSKAQETILEIDLNALKHNFEFIRSKINSSTRILAVVKAFGYGTDAVTIAEILEKLDANYFAVAYVKEGIELRQAGIKTPILVLHPQVINLKDVIKYCLEPNLYSKRILDAFIDLAESEHQKQYPVHIKFNTGLNRLGFTSDDVSYILSKANNSSSIKIASFFSHLVASEDMNEIDFSNNQIRSFKQIAKTINKGLNYRPMMHMLNTSGILNYPEAQFDMVRAGISLFGFANDHVITKNLKNVVTLKSIISQIHTIEPGESVGYNRAYKAENLIKSATIPIGHADGIHRAFGNKKGYVTIQGKKAYIIGNVCMDMLMVDVTDIDCNEGDEVIIFDSQETIDDLALRINTIPYEILTAVSQRVKRVVK